MKKLLILMVLIFIFIPNSTMANSYRTDEKEALKIAETVKEILSISDDFDKFKYSNSDYDKIWNLTWYSKKQRKEIHVVYKDDKILFCSFMPDKENNKMIAGITQQAAEKNAWEFIKKVCPEYIESIKLTSVDTRPTSDYHIPLYEFKFELHKNEIPVKYAYISVDVYRHDGEIRSFGNYIDGMLGINNYFPQPKDDIGKEKAKEIYFDNLGAGLKYIPVYNNKLEKDEIKLLYSLDDMMFNHAIDVNSGEIITFDGAIEMDTYKTDDYKEEVLSVDEAIEKKFKNLIEQIDDGHMIIYSGKTLYYFYSDHGELIINKAKKELVSFKLDKLNTNLKYSKNPIDEDILQKIADEFLEQYGYNYLSNVKQNMFYTSALLDADSSNYYYMRHVNGINYMGNGIFIDVDKYTGKITRYLNIWFNSDFPKVKNIISEKDMQNLFCEVGGFRKQYCLTRDFEWRAVYGLSKEYFNGINPFDKDYIYNFDGYSDLAENEYKDIINILWESGFYLPVKEFEADAKITKGQFLLFMDSEKNRDYMNDTEPITGYEAEKLIFDFLRFDIYDVSEESYKQYMNYNLKFNTDKELTRGEAAEVIYYSLKIKEQQ